MSRLLDTHVLLEILQSTLTAKPSKFEEHFHDETVPIFASACSLWEIAIKVRLGKLKIDLPLELLANYFESLDISILSINRYHTVTSADPEPPTRDPFDRMLLGQCKVENLFLVTTDRALVDHPLAWQTAR